MWHLLTADYWYLVNGKLSYRCRCNDQGEPKPHNGTADHRITPGRIARAKYRLDFWIEPGMPGVRHYKRDPYDAEYVAFGPTRSMTVELWWVYRRAQMVLARELRTAEKLTGMMRHNDTHFWSEAKRQAEALSYEDAWNVGERC